MYSDIIICVFLLELISEMIINLMTSLILSVDNFVTDEYDSVTVHPLMIFIKHPKKIVKLIILFSGTFTSQILALGAINLIILHYIQLSKLTTSLKSTFLNVNKKIP